MDVITLDDYAARANLRRVDLIKLDVQGAELQALQGAAQLLQAHGPSVLCELVDVYWGSSQTTTSADLLRFMNALGYAPPGRSGDAGKSTNSCDPVLQP